MTTAGENQSLHDRVAALRETLTDRLGPQLIQNPQLADALTEQIEDIVSEVEAAEAKTPPPPDGGLAELIGIGKDAAAKVNAARMPEGVEDYDEQVASERILAVADLYYIYQHERMGVFRAIKQLQQLFYAGAVRLSTGDGAYGLYRFDRRKVLRFNERERLQAYRRVLGYTTVRPAPNAQPNNQFHPLFVQFTNNVAELWRDKRIADVIRERAFDPSFASIATARRAGLDLRYNLKWASYGHVNVMRIEVLQLLDEAFRILGAEDIKRLFGADNAWDVVEEVVLRYHNRHVDASVCHRMAVTGRDIIRWLAQKHILNKSRAEFEALLREIAETAEEWLTSAETLGIGYRGHVQRVINVEPGRNGARGLRNADIG